MGNPIVVNDRIGILIGKQLEKDLSGKESIEYPEIREFTGSPLAFVNEISGYSKVIIIDSVATGLMEPGSVVLFSKEELLQHSSQIYLHGMNLPEAIRLREELACALPTEIKLIGIEVPRIDRFGDELSSELKGKENSIYRSVRETLFELIGF